MTVKALLFVDHCKSRQTFSERQTARKAIEQRLNDYKSIPICRTLDISRDKKSKAKVHILSFLK